MRASTKALPCALIAAGALASIATSRVVPGWSLAEKQDFPAAVLDDLTPSVRYQVHVELHGVPGEERLDGRAEAFVYVESREPSTISRVTIELRSVTHPDILPTITEVATGRDVQYSSIDAWLACTGDPCVEDFELVVRREPGLPAVDVHGWMQSFVSGSSDAMPPNTTVTVAVTKP